jgi:5'-deoxynucleotidase YfbR-like HD superfamily hydrolase
MDAGLPDEFRHVQSILEHAAMTAKLAEFVWLAYGKVLAVAGETIDPVRASFLASHHDDPEWKTGDTVPVLGYKSFGTASKTMAEHDAMNDLLGQEPNFLREAYEEYEERRTGAAKLAKTCDILELFCHNRVLLSFGYGIITMDNYRTHAPETFDESLKFIHRSPYGVTSIAEILEYQYTERFAKLGFPPVYEMVFAEVAEAARSFPFWNFISLER